MTQFFWMSMGFLAIVGGLGVAYYSIWLQSRARQMKHKERMAVIEKGILPPALMEADAVSGRGRHSQRGSGVFMICMGIALSLMMWLTSGIKNVWIGAFIALFGVANLINAHLDDRDRRKSPPPQITKSPDL